MSEQYSYVWLVWECSMPSRLSRESIVSIASVSLENSALAATALRGEWFAASSPRLGSRFC